MAAFVRREPYFIEDDIALDVNHFYLPQHYQDDVKHLLVPHGMIVDRIEKLAYDISRDYEGQTIHMLCVLKGGSTFFADLVTALRRFHDCKKHSSRF
jgi:hypoxanthine phosphoribosyltransferase